MQAWVVDGLTQHVLICNTRREGVEIHRIYRRTQSRQADVGSSDEWNRLQRCRLAESTIGCCRKASSSSRPSWVLMYICREESALMVKRLSQKSIAYIRSTAQTWNPGRCLLSRPAAVSARIRNHGNSSFQSKIQRYDYSSLQLYRRCCFGFGSRDS